MDIIEEPKLFGAKADWIAGVTLGISLSQDHFHVVTLAGRVNNRRDPMTLVVIVDRVASVAHVVGQIVPVMLRGQHMDPALLRRWLWSLHSGLGAEGYEVALKGCGKNPD